jgi:hypothetical protein
VTFPNDVLAVPGPTLPLWAFDFTLPADGAPALCDWLGVLQSFVARGMDLRREPIDCCYLTSSANTPVQPGIVKPIKGYSRLTAAAYIMMYILNEQDPDITDMLPKQGSSETLFFVVVVSVLSIIVFCGLLWLYPSLASSSICL